jgi:hypothetical protein
LKLQNVEQLAGTPPCTSMRSKSPFPNSIRGNANIFTNLGMIERIFGFLRCGKKSTFQLL